MLMAFVSSTRLLSTKQLWILVGVIFGQVALGVLDLVGILLVGVVAATSLGAFDVGTSASGIVGQGSSWLPAREGLSTTVVLALIAGTLLVFKSLASFWLTRFLLRFMGKLHVEVSQRVVRTLLDSSDTTSVKRSALTHTMVATRGSIALSVGVLGEGIVFIYEALVFLVVCGGLALFNPFLAIYIVLFFALTIIILQRVLGRLARKVGTAAVAIDDESADYLLAGLDSYRELRVFGNVERFVSGFASRRFTAGRVHADARMLGLVSKYVLDVLLVIGAALLVAIELGISGGTEAFITLAVFLLASVRLLPVLLRMQTALLQMRLSEEDAGRTWEFVQQHGAFFGEPRGGSNARDKLTLTRDSAESEPDGEWLLIMDDVSFAYGSKPVFSNVNLCLPRNGLIGISGPSGSGKTTLLELLGGVIRPTSGIIQVMPAAAIHRLTGSRTLVAIASQTPALLPASVRDNLAFFDNPNAFSEGEYWSALELTGMLPFVRDLPGELDCIVGRPHRSLSGGQSQRISISRAILRKPQLLLLDEPTSALDSAAKAKVLVTLKELAQDQTLVVVSHDALVLSSCDAILSVTDGAITWAPGMDPLD